MILGLSWAAWLLLTLSTVPGLVLVVAFYFRMRNKVKE
jgi:hypothetical protein